MYRLKRKLFRLLPPSIRKKIRLISSQLPMRRVVSKLEKRMDLSNFDALELFGFTGEMHTQGYVKKIRSLVVWEYQE